jgi:transcriptional regulator with XRE-family HTH domain
MANANERLRAALLERGLTPTTLADEIKVDPKTVERWITTGRAPYRRYRFAVAARLGMDEAYLWPDALSPEEVAAAAQSEILTVYPHRWAMSRDAWLRLFGSAKREIGILVYAAMFLAEDAGMIRLLAGKARDGVRVRLLFGDPDSPAVAERGNEEGIDTAIGAKIRNALVLYRPVRDAGAEIRLHRTALYNSIYHADDQLLVNAHIYGIPAANAPGLHLRRVAGGDMVATYLASFERVWDGAAPLQ